MIPLGLRLVISGGREAVIRFLVLAVAVGLGVGLLLTAVAATNAVTTWNNSHAWLWTGTASVPAGPATAGIAPLWWHPSGDTFDGQNIDRFDVAATGASSPVPPGITRDPGPGQYYASPALAALLRSTPADELAGRYPGRLAGIIGDAALSSPDSLVIIIGRTPAQLAGTPGSAQVTSIATTVPGNFGQLLNRKGLAYTPASAGIESKRHRPHPVRRGAGHAGPGADLHRHRDPAVGRPPRAAVRGDAPGRRDPQAGLPARRDRIDGGRGPGGSGRVRDLLPAARPGRGHPVPRRAVLPRRHVAQPARHPRGRDRRAGGRRRGGPAGAAPGAHLPARRRPPDHAGAAAGLAGAAATGRPGRARLLRRARHPGIPGRGGLGAPVRLPAHHRRPGHRGPVAHHGRGPGHGPADQPPWRADRRPSPRRRPEGRLPRRQRPGARPVRHHRRRGEHHHAGRQGRHAVGHPRGRGRGDGPAGGVGLLHVRARARRGRRGTGRARRAARGPAARDSRRPGGGRGPRGPEADHPRDVPQPRHLPGRLRPDSGGRDLVRAARVRSRPWPLPGRGDSGGVPGRRVRRPPGRHDVGRDHLAGRERPGLAA